MLFGIDITPLMLEIGGIILGLCLIFQVLAGQRIIKLPRKYHLKVHRTMGWVVLALATAHGILAFAYFSTIQGLFG